MPGGPFPLSVPPPAPDLHRTVPPCSLAACLALRAQPLVALVEEPAHREVEARLVHVLENEL
eukprot:6820828-Prymnesium_polylepis.1